MYSFPAYFIQIGLIFIILSFIFFLFFFFGSASEFFCVQNSSPIINLCIYFFAFLVNNNKINNLRSCDELDNIHSLWIKIEKINNWSECDNSDKQYRSDVISSMSHESQAAAVSFHSLEHNYTRTKKKHKTLMSTSILRAHIMKLWNSKLSESNRELVYNYGFTCKKQAYCTCIHILI